MSAYFEYLRQMLVRFFSDLGTFFNKTFAYPWADVPHNFNDYGSYLNAASPSFGFWGWFFFVLFAILFAALIGAIVFFIVIGIRKYVRFVKRELDKDELRSQVEKLNYELYQSTLEKDKILNLKTAYMGLRPDEQVEAKKELEAMASRFPKLVGVDAAYRGINMDIPARPGLSLEEICNSFRNFAASKLGLYYTIDAIRQLFAGMGTAKLIILEGISGTGKTSLPYCLGRFFKNNANICSVQPSWRDRSELLGYYNDFTHKFTETEFLRAVYESTYRDDNNLIVLDEMNLARIEYYFAEFLSIMEMPNVAEWNIDLIAAPRDDDPKHLHNGKLLIPQNIFFIGTANNDDSTFTITDKVYDRAMSLFFDNKGQPFEAPYTEALTLPYAYLDNLYNQAKKDYPLSQDTLEKFEKLDEYVIEHFKLAFGNRIMKQMNAFVPCYVACGGTELDAVDYVFKTKILKKFEVLNVAFLRDELAGLDVQLTKLFGKNEFPLSRDKIRLLIKMSR